MLPNNRRRSASILPELTLMTALAVVCFTPLVLSTGLETPHGLLNQAFAVANLLRFEPLVGLDSWLHWGARVLLLAGLLNVVLRRIRPLWAFHRRMRTHPALPVEMNTDLGRLAVKYDVLSSTNVLPAAHGPVAFTAGLIRPKTYLGRTLLAKLDAYEIELLLLHEVKHCRSRDPFRSLVTTVLGDLFFWLPVVPHLASRVISKIEFGADDEAAKVNGTRLAETILKVAQVGNPTSSGALASFTGGADLSARIRRLIHDGDASPSRSPRKMIYFTVLLIIAVWTLSLTAYGTHNAHLGW